MKYKWELNASTGDHIARINDNTRLIRMRGGGLYSAEFWGDCSLKYPICSATYRTPANALIDLQRELERNGETDIITINLT